MNTGPMEFLFRGNAVAAGGFLTRLGEQPIALDPQVATTHGESCLPLIGGVSHSLVEKPQLRFPQFISYGRCETFVEGRYQGNQTITTLRASVSDVRLTTSPSSWDNVPNVKAISLRADNLTLEVQSIHPQTGEPSFKINAIQPLGMHLVLIDPNDKESPLPITLVFDQHLLALATMQDMDNEFLGNRQFFDEHVERFPTHEKPVFGSSRMPRTPQGYVVTSFVRQIQVGTDVFHGNVLTRRGFGTIRFGVILADPYSRRISMALIRMGSDPAADVNLDAVETNGIWK